MVGFFQSYTVTLYGTHHLVDSLILSNDLLFQFLSHTFQADTFFLSHALNRYPRHHRNHFSHLFGSHFLTHVNFAIQPFAIHFL